MIRRMLLDPCQLSMLDEYDTSGSMKHVILCSRRLGKSFALTTLAIEVAMQKPRQYIKYLTSTGKAAREIVLPLFNMILQTCPEEARPTYNIHEAKWTFPNKSEILLHGTDKDKGEGLRGQSADLAIIDEAGFVDSLDTVVKDILLPMVVEREGRLLLSSTPPRESSHPFLSFIAEAERKGALTKRVLTDCPRFTQKQLDVFAEEAGGTDSDTYRREYLCEIILDSALSVVPEFNDSAIKEIVFSEPDKLDYLPDTYVSLDPGFSDNTAILYGYWDFPKATLVIQREYVAKGNSTDEIAKAIKDIEKELWGPRPPYKRISDTDLRLIEDLRKMHNLRFVKTEKDMKEMQINLLRIMVKKRQIRIHESCKNLISQLKFGEYKISASGNRDFKRTAELGHLDATDALLYMLRNVSKHRNPIPEEGYNPHTQMSYWDAPANNLTGNARKLSKAFVKRR